MLDDFEKQYGYKMRAEDLVDAGYYNQPTVFYDMDGVEQELTLKPYEIKWIQK